MLAMAYFKFALAMCRMTKTAPSILLHPLDFIGCDDVGELDFFPGMDMTAERKIDIVDRVISELGKYYELGTMIEHVQSVGTDLREFELQVAAS